MRIKLEFAPRPNLLAAEAGETLDGYRIAWSLAGDPQAILDVPDDIMAESIDRVVLDWVARGLVVDDGRGLWRPEHTDYRPLWLAGELVWAPRFSVKPYASVGDTFALHGVTEATRRRGRDGAGASVLICDTGVDTGHAAFDGVAFVGDTGDGQGHGTHVASTAASRWGIAPQATLVAKTALPNGQGSETTVARAIRDATEIARVQGQGMVMNLSLGGSISSIIDAAVQYARQAGVLVCAAAGNTPSAAIGSPARAADLIVLACDRARQYASFTSGRTWPHPNRVTATGVDILAAAQGTRDMTLLASGTSMACPHIVGLAALLLASGMGPRQVAATLGG